MSALGQKQTFAVQNVMSALPSIADICSAQAHVRFVPIADMLSYSITSSVGARRENRKGAEGEWQPQFIAHAPV
jgi:hypothetical protein